MHLSTLMLANDATLDDAGLLHVTGGCWEFVDRTEFPTTIGMAIVAVLDLADDDLFGASTRLLSCRVREIDGDVLGAAGAAELVSVRYRTPVIMSAQVELSRPTGFIVDVLVDGEVLGSVRCPVRQRPAD